MIGGGGGTYSGLTKLSEFEFLQHLQHWQHIKSPQIAVGLRYG